MIAVHVYSARTGKHAFTDDSHAVVSVCTDEVGGKISAVGIYANAPDGRTLSLEINGGALKHLIAEINRLSPKARG